MSFIWNESEINSFLDPYDAYLSTNLLLNTPNQICEIGVYRGAWVLCFLNNHPSSSILAIDPYPGLEDVKKLFLSQIESLGFKENVTLVDDLNHRTNLFFDLVHIDGEHTERAILRDIYFALKHLADRGAIVIDDIWHPLFPGITSGVMKVVHESDLVPFLSTRNKMWLCRTRDYEAFFERSLFILDQKGIGYTTGVVRGDEITGTQEKHTYDISNAIRGFTQIVVQRVTRYEQLINLGLRKKSANEKTKSFVKQWTPPIFLNLLKKLKTQHD